MKRPFPAKKFPEIKYTNMASDAPQAKSSETIAKFQNILVAVASIDPKNPEREKVLRVWQFAFEHLNQGASEDEIRSFLWGAAPFLAKSRDALRKQFKYQLKLWQKNGQVKDQREENGRDSSPLSQKILDLGWFIPAAEWFYLKSNRTKYSGSLPEAIRRTISLPVGTERWPNGLRNALLNKIGMEEMPTCPEAIREEILERQKKGKDLVSESIARRITQRCSAAIVQFNRNPTEAALRFANAAGGSKFTRASGEYVPLRAGQRMMPDDGSINFCVCVPWKFPTSVTSRKFGVLVGRFQLLLSVDALTQRICARSFVVRPRESYRTEDALHLYNVFMRQHGIPDEIYHEGNVWNAGRVKDCLDSLGVRRQLLHSPHAKQAVEGRFNKLWTVLSCLTGGQIGRYRGEMERENDLLRSCRTGATDPRRVFPMFADALAYMDQAIEEANATPVNTDVGLWVPDELWAEQLAETPLRKFDDSEGWKFAPVCAERTMRNGVNLKYPMFEELSVPFNFAAPWMHDYETARVGVYFDPWGARETGTVVLRQSWNGKKAGEVLGEATQTNDIANYARLMLDLGTGPNDSARRIRQQQISAMRSNRKAIVAGGGGLVIEEQRDGIDQAGKLERDGITVQSAEGASENRLRENLSVEQKAERDEYTERYKALNGQDAQKRAEAALWLKNKRESNEVYI